MITAGDRVTYSNRLGTVAKVVYSRVSFVSMYDVNFDDGGRGWVSHLWIEKRAER
jgi:hypothetical protein